MRCPACHELLYVTCEGVIPDSPREGETVRRHSRTGREECDEGRLGRLDITTNLLRYRHFGNLQQKQHFALAAGLVTDSDDWGRVFHAFTGQDWRPHTDQYLEENYGPFAAAFHGQEHWDTWGNWT